MTTARPLIGLSTYREPARWGVWQQSADLLPTTYAEAVLSVGGAPVLLPPSAPYDEVATAVLGRLDALVISGGADVDPAAYGEDPGPQTDRPRVDRDAWERALLDAADEIGLPVLGVCRGMQVMAVHAGGVLDQHVPDVVGHTDHSPGADVFGTTHVTIDADSAIARALGTTTADVQCHHHQAVRTHPGFVPVARSADGVLEAMEAVPVDGVNRFHLAVQWHPEEVADIGLFAALVEAASGPRRR